MKNNGLETKFTHEVQNYGPIYAKKNKKNPMTISWKSTNLPFVDNHTSPGVKFIPNCCNRNNL